MHLTAIQTTLPRFAAKKKIYTEAEVDQVVDQLAQKLSPADQTFLKGHALALDLPLISVHVSTPDEVQQWTQKLLAAGAKRGTVDKIPCLKFKNIPIIVEAPAPRRLIR